MTNLKNLSVFIKVNVITVIAMLALITVLILNALAISENNKSLDELKDKRYLIAQYSTANSFIINRIDERYTQAVTFGDEDLITSAGEQYNLLIENIEKIESLDNPSNSRLLEKFKSDLQSYNVIAKDIVKGFINESLDFSVIQQKSKVKADLYENINKALDEYKKQSDDLYSKMADDAKARSEDAITQSIIISIVLTILIILLGYIIGTNIRKAASDAAATLSELAEGEGDLKSRLNVDSEDEIGQLAINFNKFMEVLRGAISDVMSVVQPLLDNSTRLIQRMETAESAMHKQSEDSELVNQSMQEMHHSVNEISNSAALASQATSDADLEAKQSLEILSQSMAVSQALNNEIKGASAVVHQLAQDTQNVNKILDVITSIAEQTNLLALNAAIEAARAGEQGRGFAVVADEVRELASRTSKSTTEIRELLNALTEAASASVDSMESASAQAERNEEYAAQTGDSVKKIAEHINTINGINSQVATATEQQTAVTTTVVENVNDMNESISSTLEALSGIRDVSSNLHTLSDDLLEAASKFKL
ncbi:MAG: methyl-accepting chemotaxis protein [Psychrosphaera sp.]|uniref:HAMP domain-containing methyl-accepting chemotaxis protein n=1 Tax=Psychrosphaera aquimarina TaxID=2044854 RepID=A0ABU3R367_9GAMM|nr:HAMP domain-containing methyl-accepting chemotaxis protein [Psychrosphaera aquimarina]MDU0114115.1 HAMP domain-containing methyl-accepting chemotaxis protein [Psychrosphaera aquimarina]